MHVYIELCVYTRCAVIDGECPHKDPSIWDTGIALDLGESNELSRSEPEASQTTELTLGHRNRRILIWYMTFNLEYMVCSIWYSVYGVPHNVL